MALRKRGERYWTIFKINGQLFRNPLRPPGHSRATTDRREAVQLERDLIEQARNGALAPKAGPSRLFAACDAYVAAKRKLDGVSNRTVNMDVGELRKVLKRYGHWRRLQDHVTMLSETQGAPIGRALTPDEQKRLLEAAASNPEWEHVYCAAVLAANTSMRGVEVKHVRRKDVDLEKPWDAGDGAAGRGVLYVSNSMS